MSLLRRPDFDIPLNHKKIYLSNFLIYHPLWYK